MIDNSLTPYLLLKNIISENIISLSLAVESLRFLEVLQNECGRIPEDIILDIKELEMCDSDYLDDYLLLPDDIKNKCDNFVHSSSKDSRDIDRAARYSYVKRFLMKPRDLNTLKKI